MTIPSAVLNNSLFVRGYAPLPDAYLKNIYLNNIPR